MEDNNKIAETQAGFRKGYTTTDHVFTLYAITQKYLSRPGGKLYVAFIDLRKAFDSVRRDTLLNMLCSAGISNTLINAVKANYGKVLLCVRVNGEFIDMFDCPQGLRQGCVLSPTLFSIVINEIATSVANEGKHVYSCSLVWSSFSFCSSLTTWHSCHARHMDSKYNLTVYIDCVWCLGWR